MVATNVPQQSGILVSQTKFRTIVFLEEDKTQPRDPEVPACFKLPLLSEEEQLEKFGEFSPECQDENLVLAVICADVA